jgi:hypothetical protein
MRVVGSIPRSSPAFGGDVSHSAKRDADAASARQPSVALVAVNPHPSTGHSAPTGAHASAPFLTQLIATEQFLPQTRQYRRGSPEDANEAYGAGLKRAAPRASEPKRRTA